MNERERALYRYLTLWADFTPEEARNYVFSPRNPQALPAQTESLLGIAFLMEQTENAA